MQLEIMNLKARRVHCNMEECPKALQYDAAHGTPDTFVWISMPINETHSTRI